jgi:hypothetical protein
MSKIQVDRLDSFRILLTETLPYETPLFFSNIPLYKYARSSASTKNTSIPPLVKLLLDAGKFEPTIPYEYKILKSANKPRTLSIVHPSNQIRFVQFYDENSGYIPYLCSRSEFSLRTPAAVAAHYFEKALKPEEKDSSKDLGPEEEREAFEEQARYASSYFVYKRYAFLYKFYESQDYKKLEKRFHILKSFDISRCFESIYTHSIGWAIKGKEFAKQAIERKSLEDNFDELIRSCNYNETHGIVIGPEFSRIFAEIILQRVDIESKRQLDRQGLRFKVDYQVRRYIDDYFVFSNSTDTVEKVFSIFEAELHKYKLHLNESKTNTATVPFATPLTIAKQGCRETLEQSLLQMVDQTALKSKAGSSSKLFIVKSPFRVSNRIVDKLKVNVKSSGGGYEGVTGYCLSIVRRQLAEIFSSRLKKRYLQEPKGAQDCLLATLEVAFFLYAMDMRVRPTYLICQIIWFADRTARKLGDEAHDAIHKKIIDELIDALERTKASGGLRTIEAANLLTVLRSLERTFDLPEQHLRSYFGLARGSHHEQKGNQHRGFSDLDYFEIVSILYYVRDHPEYNSTRTELFKEVERRFAESSKPQKKTELTLMFLDLVSCPYVPTQTKHKIITNMSSRVLKTNAPSTTDLNRVINFCTKSLHFVNWSGGLDISYALRKKELRTPYGE